MKRFLDKINKTNTCWLWTGGKFDSGYGQFYVNGKPVRAHRFSFELFKGPIPADLLVRHTCDIRICVNPDHLELGTQEDNCRDMVSRRRSLPGSKNPFSKLDERKVKAIRKEYDEGLSQSKLATKYKVSKHQIGRIVRNEAWNHV